MVHVIQLQVMISTHNKYDDHTQMMSNVHECRVRCGGYSVWCPVQYSVSGVL